MTISDSKPTILAAFSALTLAGCLAVAAATSFPMTGLAAFTDLSWVREARAQAATATRPLTSTAIASAGDETLRGLRSDPANPTPWLRLAYLDAKTHGRLTAIGVDALSRSYSLAPLGPDNRTWRLRFVFNHWAQLDRQTRLMATEELRVAARLPIYQSFDRRIGDPTGRFAARLILRQIRREESWRAGARRASTPTAVAVSGGGVAHDAVSRSKG